MTVGPMIVLRDCFRGQDIYVVGAGTSLRGFDFTLLHKRVWIAINEVIFHCEPEVPNVHIFHDMGVAKLYGRGAPRNPCIVVTRADPVKAFYAGVLEYYKGNKEDAAVIMSDVYLYTDMVTEHDKNSNDLWIDTTTSTGAIELAWKMGAKRVFLLGCDAYRRPGQKYFWEPPVPGRQNEVMSDPYMDAAAAGKNPAEQKDFVQDHRKLSVAFHLLEGKGVCVPQVFNLSPSSNIDAWPKLNEFPEEDGLYVEEEFKIPVGKDAARTIDLTEDVKPDHLI